MTQNQSGERFQARENTREQLFRDVWSDDLDEVFADVAPYYDRANQVASLGLWSWMQNSFVDTIELPASGRVLDVCTGTNQIAMSVLQKQPNLDVYAIDRSLPMQIEGCRVAESRGLEVTNINGDAHYLPFPDNSFDVVTLQYASRHLKVLEAFSEIRRVLKPGGHFYHADMLRPGNRLVGFLYRTYLHMTLNITAFVFGSAPASHRCKQYFVRTMHMFYSAEELSNLLEDLGFHSVTSQTLLGGMVGSHRAVKDS